MLYLPGCDSTQGSLGAYPLKPIICTTEQVQRQVVPLRLLLHSRIPLCMPSLAHSLNNWAGRETDLCSSSFCSTQGSLGAYPFKSTVCTTELVQRQVVPLQLLLHSRIPACICPLRPTACTTEQTSQQDCVSLWLLPRKGMQNNCVYLSKPQPAGVACCASSALAPSKPSAEISQTHISCLLLGLSRPQERWK